jgi:hypothetical protein
MGNHQGTRSQGSEDMAQPQRVTFDELSARLREYECKYGYSTIEFYRRYENGEMGDDDDVGGAIPSLFDLAAYPPVHVAAACCYPIRVSYAYTYLRNRQRVFRYDNAPHHPEIVTHSHHKHVGPADRLAPADQPGLNQVLAEVESWLNLG